MTPQKVCSDIDKEIRKNGWGLPPEQQAIMKVLNAIAIMRGPTEDPECVYMNKLMAVLDDMESDLRSEANEK